MSGEWYEDHRNLAVVARWMEDQGDSVGDVAYMLEKPWKFEDAWRDARLPAETERGRARPRVDA